MFCLEIFFRPKMTWQNLLNGTKLFDTWQHYVSELMKVTQITPTTERRKKSKEWRERLFMASGVLLRSLRCSYSASSSYRFHSSNVRTSLARRFCSMPLEFNQKELDFSIVPVAFHKEKSVKSAGNLHMGMDFGGTNIRVAVMEGGFAKVIHNAPSVVAFNENGQSLVGTQAKIWAKHDPTNTIFGIQRLLGRKFDDPELQREMKVLPYKIVRGPDGDACVEAFGEVYSPKQIAAVLIGDMKELAESYYGNSVSKAVITFPIWWKTSDQLLASFEAGAMAGLDLQVGINEPIAAALSYGKEGLIAVLDFGGKSFKASILKISKVGGMIKSRCGEINIRCRLTTISSSADICLGGEDFDNLLVEFLVSEIKRTQTVDLTNDKLILQRLRQAAEKAKIELSSRLKTEIFLPSFITDASGAKHLSITLTRSEFESLANNLIERAKNTCKICLKKACITVDQVDEVFLVGGMARVPKVQNIVAEIFGKEPSKGVNPDEAIVVGATAAIQNGIIRKDVWDFLNSDVVNPDNIKKGVVQAVDVINSKELVDAV